MRAGASQAGDRALGISAATAARADGRADDLLAVARADFLLAEAGRLDDGTRHALRAAMQGAIAGVEQAIRRHAARLLADRGAPALAEALLTASVDVAGRLMRAGLLADERLVDELLAQVRQGIVVAALPVAAADPDRPSLIVRLAEAPDALVARAAAALLAADNRRRAMREGGAAGQADMPAELYHRLVWRVAAAICDDPEADRAVAEAALRCIAAHDEGEHADAAAMRVAVALDPRPAELPDLLVEAIGDGHLGLFIALLAQAAGLPQVAARAITLEPDGARLWTALRALDLPRTTIARIGLALSEADGARDVEAFADGLDALMTLDSEQARTALAPLTLPCELLAAIRALARSERR